MSDPAAHAQMLENRVRKNAKHRRKWAAKAPTEAYRLYDHDIPEVPVVVDRYADHLLVSDVRRADEVEAGGDAWFEAACAAAARAAGVDEANVHGRARRRQKGSAQYERLDTRGDAMVVEECGLRFEVNLDDYLDSGLFLDHRPLRGHVREHAAGRRVLNLFAYTGSFSVYALSGDASLCTTVDLSRTYLDWGRRNLALNGLLDARDERVHADVLAFLADAAAANKRWDLVVVDPPTFSNSKRTEHTFDVQRDHAALLAAVFRVTTPGAPVFFSTNRRGFRLDEELGGAEDITSWSIPKDFSQRRPHKAWRFVG